MAPNKKDTVQTTYSNLLCLLKELIIDRGFDPALMEDPFFLDLLNTFYEDNKSYSLKEADNFLNMVWYCGMDSGRICFALYDRRKKTTRPSNIVIEKNTEYNTIDKIVSSTITHTHLQSLYFEKEESNIENHHKKQMDNHEFEKNIRRGGKYNHFILFSLAILFCLWIACMYFAATYGETEILHYSCLGGGGVFTGILISLVQKIKY